MPIILISNQYFTFSNISRAFLYKPSAFKVCFELAQNKANVIKHLSILLGSFFSKNLRAYLNQNVASYSNISIYKNLIVQVTNRKNCTFVKNKIMNKTYSSLFRGGIKEELAYVQQGDATFLSIYK